LQVNINTIDQVKEFFYSDYEAEKIYSVFTKIPSKYEKKNKLFFHGVKNNMSNEISKFIKNFYLNNQNFDIICDRYKNRVFISCDAVLEVEILMYEWSKNFIRPLYNTTTSFNNNRFWYSASTELSKINGIKIEIKYNNRIIKEKIIRFDIKKQVLVLHSDIGIGDNLAATPTIKKISENYDQKVILLTYLPEIFINNPYIEDIVKINRNDIYDVINLYNNNDHNITNFFIMNGQNWRLIDHKQLCAYNAGFQLKQNELDMEFYPDPYEHIENLPEKFICINPSETEPERTWGYKNWQKFIDLIQEHIPVVAIGKETYLDPSKTKKFSNIEIKNGLNLLNHPAQNTLSQAYHIISKSETFITMNNGLYILSLCNLDNHITELQTSWNTTFYRTRKGIENYNLDYIKGNCQAECLANPKISIEITGSTEILKSGICYLNKSTYECHPTPEQVYESVLNHILSDKKIKNLIFFNYANNGDIFASREFVKYIINNTNVERYIYQQKNSSRLLLDIEKLEHTKEINGDVTDGIYFVGDDVYINTWFNSLTFNNGVWNHGKYNNGSNLKSLYDYFFNELPLTLNIKISENMYDFIPTIDFSKYNISKIKDFMINNKVKEKIFIANGDAKSNQSDNNINFDIIIDNISNYYKDMLIFVSNPTIIKKENIIYIKDLLTKNLDNDMYECAYVFTFCKYIIGRYSGVSACTYIRDNMYKNKIYILVVNENLNWDIDFSLKDCNTQFIPCNLKNTEDVSNFIIDKMKEKTFN
jgi:hypothetical protein